MNVETSIRPPRNTAHQEVPLRYILAVVQGRYFEDIRKQLTVAKQALSKEQNPTSSFHQNEIQPLRRPLKAFLWTDPFSPIA
jgi:uncharacterized GH25 family protein